MFRRLKISRTLVLSIACLGIFTAVFSSPALAADINKTTNEDVAVEISQSDLAQASGLPSSVYYSATVSSPTKGTFAVDATNTKITYTPGPNYYGSDSFVVRVFTGGDKGSQYAEVRINITINAVNDDPTFVTTALPSVNELAAYAATVTADDVDAGDTLRIGSDGLPSWLTLTDNGDKTATISGTAPSVSEDTAYSFYITLRDGSNTATVSRQFTVTVKNINNAPIALRCSLAGVEDVPTAQVVSAWDPDEDVLQYSFLTVPVHGAAVFVLPDGPLESETTIIYTPNQDWYGDNERFIYLVEDGQGGSATAEVTVKINPVNDPPVASDISVSTGEEAPVPILLIGSDIDSAVLTYHYEPPLHGVLSGTAPNLTYTPSASYNGDDSFTYLATDGDVVSRTATVTITIAAVNDAPEFTSVPVTVAYTMDLYTYLVIAADVDADTLLMSAVDKPNWLTFSDNGDGTGTLSGTPMDPGIYPLKLTVNDGQAEATQSFEIVVSTINHAPVASDAIVTTAEDTPVTFTLPGSDPDGDTLSYSIYSLPADGSVVAVNGGADYIYTPNANYFGTDLLGYQVNDGNGGTDSGVITINVTADNDLPHANQPPEIETIGTLTATEAATFQYSVVASDADGDVLSYSLFNHPSWLTISGDGVMSTTSPLPYDASGVYSLQVLVSDGENVATEEFILVVNNTNRAPIITACAPEGDQVFTVGAQPGFTVAAYDPDGDALNYFWSTTAGRITSSSTNPAQVVYTATTAGDAQITLIVTDQFGDSASASWNVRVSAIPDSEPPLVSATVLGIEGNNGYYRSKVIVNLEASDTGSGIAKIVYTTANGTAVEIADDATVVTITEDGSFTYSVYAVDWAGNLSEIVPFSFSIDQNAPVIDSIKVDAVECTDGVVNLGVIHSSSPVIYASITDSGSGISSSDINIKINNGAALSVAASAAPVNSAGANSDTANTSSNAYDIRYTTLGSAQIGTGTTPVTITARDLAGNEATETFNIITEALAEGYVYPNPSDPSVNPITFLVGLSEATQIQISVYDENARLIKSIIFEGQEGNNAVSWDGVNEFGSLIGNGLFPYRVIDLTHRQILYKGKLVVVRSR
ncbi:MAG: tandem-95 repeat protein [Candidatus Margulisiibacteriota bacterium]